MSFIIFAPVVLFGSILAGTLLLQGISGRLLRKMQSNMGIVPLIIGIIIAILTIVIIKNDPFSGLVGLPQSMNQMEDFDGSLKTIKTWGIAFCLFLLMIVAFFMKLNSTDKKYSLASGVGIFGALCGIVAFLIMYLTYKKVFDNDGIEIQIIIICYRCLPITLLAAVSLLCGAVFNTSKIIRYACLFLIVCYFISSTDFWGNIAYLTLDTDVHDWNEFNDNRKSSEEAVKYLKYAPFAGWIILTVTFYLQYKKENSNN